jgi:hypothetical protein
MIARGFKPVAWVAAVGAAALCCYMLSLQVAAERAELTGLERKIVSTQRSIRSLQTELGTRARVTQLQQWNDEILALAPPEASQFLESQITLARFDLRQPALGDQAEVRMASAEVPAATPAPAAPAAAPQPQPQRAVAGARPAQPQLGQGATVQRASLTLPARPDTAPVSVRTEPRPASPPTARTARKPAPPTRTVSAEPVRRAAPTPARPRALLDERTVRDLGTAARAERRGGTRN